MNNSSNTQNLFVTDTLSCNLNMNGKMLMSFNVSGISSISDLYRYIRERLNDMKGVITLVLRNVSQGWSNRISLCLK